jgi:hypothetical protein
MRVDGQAKIVVAPRSSRMAAGAVALLKPVRLS